MLALNSSKKKHLFSNRLANLEILSFQSNRLTVLENLYPCTHLRELYASSNGITQFDEGCLQSCKQHLAVLDLASNRLSGEFRISNFPALEDLWLNHNEITTMIVDSHTMPLLSTIYLERNPIATLDNYKASMVSMVPSLTQLDALAIYK
jgi:protein phosphatase 1 regulatory subunit 7